MIISDDDFFDYFKPVPNTSKTAVSPGLNNDLFGFETFGTDLVAVQAAYKENPDCIWTVIDAEGVSVVSSGFHHVNRMAYIISSVPCPPGAMIDVVDNPPSPPHRQACFAQYNQVTYGMQAIMDTIGNEEFESYTIWIGRMLNTWSAEVCLSRTKMTTKHYALFDVWLADFVVCHISKKNEIELQVSELLAA